MPNLRLDAPLYASRPKVDASRLNLQAHFGVSQIEDLRHPLLFRLLLTMMIVVTATVSATAVASALVSFFFMLMIVMIASDLGIEA